MTLICPGCNTKVITMHPRNPKPRVIERRFQRERFGYPKPGNRGVITDFGKGVILDIIREKGAWALIVRVKGREHTLNYAQCKFPPPLEPQGGKHASNRILEPTEGKSQIGGR